MKEFTIDRETPLTAKEAIALVERLLMACEAAKPYIVRTIENDPDAPWMRGRPKEVGTVLLEEMKRVRNIISSSRT